MNGAIVRAAHRSLPAFILLTGGSFRDSRIILSEIKEFLWINFHSYSILEVLIWDFPVLIMVKLIKQSFELLFIDVKTPMIQIMLEFLRLDSTWLGSIKVSEGLLKCLPLESNLL
jgi:hypothetical protein